MCLTRMKCKLSTCTCSAAQLISQIVNARVAIVRLGDFLAADVQPELPLLPAAPPGKLSAPSETLGDGAPHRRTSELERANFVQPHVLAVEPASGP